MVRRVDKMTGFAIHTMEKEFDFRNVLEHRVKHRTYAQEDTAKEENSQQPWPVQPAWNGAAVRSVALGNQPLLVRGLLQRIVEQTPGLQVVQQPLLWLYRQWEKTPSVVNWLVLTQTATPWSQSYALPAIQACNPLSILAISESKYSVSIQPRTTEGYVATRSYHDISLQTLLSILRYAPEASHAYAQAGRN